MSMDSPVWEGSYQYRSRETIGDTTSKAIFDELLTDHPTSPHSGEFTNAQNSHIEHLVLLAEEIKKDLKERVNTSHTSHTIINKERRKQDLEEIAILGSVSGTRLVEHTTLPGGFPLDRGGMMQTSNISQKSIARLRHVAMHLYDGNARLIEEIAKKRIVLGFGSGSASLLSLIDHGILTIQKMKELGTLWGAADGELKMSRAYSNLINADGISTCYWFDNYIIGRYAIGAHPLSEASLRGRLQLSLDKEDEWSKKVSAAPTSFPWYLQPEIMHRDFALEQEIFRSGIQFLQSSGTPQIYKQIYSENFPIVCLFPTTNMDSTFFRGVDSTIKTEVMVRNPPQTDAFLILVPQQKIDIVKDIVFEKKADERVHISPLEPYLIPQHALYIKTMFSKSS